MLTTLLRVHVTTGNPRLKPCTWVMVTVKIMRLYGTTACACLGMVIIGLMMVPVIETALLRAVWYPVTVATNSMMIKNDIRAAYFKTGSKQGVDFKLHDFGARGVSSYESSMIGGLSHLVNFQGTDTVASIVAARRYYDCEMPGFSIPAAEHSTITSWGEPAEFDAYRNMLKQFGDGAMVAIVSDSYDLKNAVANGWGGELKQDVIDCNAVVIIRPDSGDPTTVPVETIEILMDKFGYTTNADGYRTLPDYVRVIQGDGIKRKSIQAILQNMIDAKMTVDNLAFGMGGALLQQVNRDTFEFAMKANAIQIEGEWFDVYKRPATDTGKSSKAGRQMLIKEAGVLKTVREGAESLSRNVLREVYRNGRLLIDDNFTTIRARVGTI